MAKPEDVILEEIDKVLDDFIDRVFQLSQENLIRDGKADTGLLLKSGNINRSFLDKEIVYTAPHAEPIEYGRTPGTMPPYHVLIGWVRRKLKIHDIKEARSVAFAVAMAIKQRGMDQSPFLRPAIEQGIVEYDL